MIKNINYTNKQAFQNNDEIPENQKVTDLNMNEIKKVVNNNATELEETQKKITTVINAPLSYKGSVEQFSNLQELENVNNGDIYSVTNENKNYVYAVNEWIEYTPEIDLTEINTQIQNIIDNIPTTIASAILEDNKKKYPIGKIILSEVDTNPATYLGFGTWKLWGSGRVPVGVDTNDSDFNEAEKTGGEKTHTLTVEEMPVHSHMGGVKSAGSGINEHNQWGNDTTQKDNMGDTYTGNTGGNQAHNNMPPYITCYMWKRVA